MKRFVNDESNVEAIVLVLDKPHFEPGNAYSASLKRAKCIVLDMVKMEDQRVIARQIWKPGNVINPYVSYLKDL